MHIKHLTILIIFSLFVFSFCETPEDELRTQSFNPSQQNLDLYYDESTGVVSWDEGSGVDHYRVRFGDTVEISDCDWVEFNSNELDPSDYGFDAGNIHVRLCYDSECLDFDEIETHNLCIAYDVDLDALTLINCGISNFCEAYNGSGRGLFEGSVELPSCMSSYTYAACIEG